MKYKYLYQDSSNVTHEGEINARNRADAYSALRKRGVRPYRVIGDDPPQWRIWVIATVYGIMIGALVFIAFKLMDGGQERMGGAELTAVEAAELRLRAEEAVRRTPEQFRYNVWKGVNARLAEYGIEPIEKPVDLEEDNGFEQ